MQDISVQNFLYHNRSSLSMVRDGKAVCLGIYGNNVLFILFNEIRMSDQRIRTMSFILGYCNDGNCDAAGFENTFCPTYMNFVTVHDNKIGIWPLRMIESS